MVERLEWVALDVKRLQLLALLQEARGYVLHAVPGHGARTDGN